MNINPKYFTRLFQLLFALQICYLMLTFFIPLPAWKMFSKMERNNFIIENSERQIIDHQQWLPTTVYSLKRERILSFSAFVCKKVENDVIILKINPALSKEQYEVRKPDCIPKKA